MSASVVKINNRHFAYNIECNNCRINDTTVSMYRVNILVTTGGSIARRYYYDYCDKCVSDENDAKRLAELNFSLSRL